MTLFQLSIWRRAPHGPPRRLALDIGQASKLDTVYESTVSIAPWSPFCASAANSVWREALCGPVV